MSRWLFPAIALALASFPVHAQSIGLAPTAPPASYSVKSRDGSGWFQFDRPNSHLWGWYQHNALIGRYNPATAAWQGYDGKSWGIPTSPPWAVQLPGAKVMPNGDVNFGLDQQRVGQRGDRYMIGGIEVSQEDVLTDMYSTTPKDDSQMPHITVIDPNDQRRAQTVQALQQQFGERARINDLSPANQNQQWATAPFKLEQDTRYRQSGQVTVVQAPADKDDKGNATGPAKVIGAHYQSGPALVQAVGRQIDPSYDPNKNGSGGFTFSWAWLWNLLLVLLGLGGGVGAMALRGGSTAKPKAEPQSLGDSIVAALQQMRADRDARIKAAQDAEAEDKKIREALLALA